MARLVLCVLALCVAGAFAETAKKVLPHKTADQTFLQRQLDLSLLYYHIHEPTFYPEQKKIAETWNIEKNIEHYSNVTAVKLWMELYDGHYLLPRAVPFSIFDPIHQFETVTLFNVLFSAKDYNTFYKTAVYLRGVVNEGLYVYVLSVAILHRPDTQGIIIPNIYEVFPSFFNNGEIMNTAQRINTHGHRFVDHYPSTRLWNNDVVISWNQTVWPYYIEDAPLLYYTHNFAFNTFYYNQHLLYPFWLGGETVPLVKDRRGERFWFIHQQILARYYMERLSNGLGEIPELGMDVVQEGYPAALTYHNGIPFPTRPSHYHLDQPQFVDELTMITDYERRIREVIDSGYYINSIGEHVFLNTPEGIDILGRLIEANVDSPNTHYYKDFITLWKQVLGNSVGQHEPVYYNHHVPLVRPSVLEYYQTSFRDPAFYMIWKRVLNLFNMWQEKLPHYRREELALPSVTINKVEVDKLVTYFDYTYMNVTNHLHLTENEIKTEVEDVSVLVEVPTLNHKAFQVRVNVKSEAAKTVVVKFFLAPKYDSKGYEIPLHENTKHFTLLDVFTYDLPEGETVIRRDSTEYTYHVEDWRSHYDVFESVEESLHSKTPFVLDQTYSFAGFPQRFILPKGRVGGMPFVFLVYITEYHAPKVKYGTGFDPAISLGTGTGATSLTDSPYGFPLDRPLYYWQIDNLRNFVIQDVNIYHKPTPDIFVPHTA